MSTKTVSQVMIETLEAAGAKRCYGIPGDTANHVSDAIFHSGIEWVHVRHEEVGAFAAGAESFITGELSVCAGSAGPGVLHFINGIYESHRNGAPVVLIATQLDRSEIGFNFPQFVDQQKIYETCSVFCQHISSPDQASRVTAIAAQTAIAERGVAVIILNGDMAMQEVKEARPYRAHRPRPVMRPADDEMDQIARMLNDAGKITIYGGIGCQGAHDQVVELARKLNAPVAHTSRAKDFLEYDNPHNVGMTGILGVKSGMKAVSECDCLLLLGTDFAYTQFYPDKAKIIQVDIKAGHIGRRHPVDIGVLGNVRDTVEALLPLVEERSDSTFLDACLKKDEKTEETLEKREDDTTDDNLIHPQHATLLLDKLADDDAIFTADGGSPMVWALRHLRVNGKRRTLISLSHGTMANAYPQAIGIKKALPDRQVIAMCGDGGLAMLLGDLLTLVQDNIPIKLMVFNNSALAFVEIEQKVAGLLDNYTDLKNPDFAKVAQAIGIHGERVEKNSDLESGIRNLLAHDGPALLDIKVNREELVWPPDIEAGQVMGTAAYMTKAVLGGRVGDVFSTFKNNFLK